MEENTFIDVRKELRQFAKAKRPINPALLEEVPYFSRIFDEKELWHLLVKLSGNDGVAYIESKQFKAGDKLIRKGQFDQMIYWILSGKVQIVTTIKNQPKVIHEAFVGECVGELGVLKGQVRTADVVACKGGAHVLELDWAITEKNAQLGMLFYHLIALNLADKLDNAYDKQIKIIANSIKILHEKTSLLIERNRKLEKLLESNMIDFDETLKIDHERALSQAIANIKESLSLLEIQESKNNLNHIGAV